MYPDPNDAIDEAERVDERLARTEPVPARTDMPITAADDYAAAVAAGTSRELAAAMADAGWMSFEQWYQHYAA